MIVGRDSEDYVPITWVGRYPVYLTTLLVGLHVAAMVLVTLCMAARGGNVVANPLLAPLIFNGADITGHFAIWQFVTYAFVNPPTLWFAVEMYLLLMFGREVEKFLGRSAFLWLYLALMLAIPTVLTGFALIGAPQVYFGSGSVHFAVFIAFVAIYPSAQIFFGFQAKWIALILLAVNSLISLSGQSWVGLLILWLETGCAYAMVRASGVRPIGEAFPIFQRDEDSGPPVQFPKLKVRKVEEAEEDPADTIDPLLEKISKHGISSLSKRERERLEKAREALLKRERGSR